MVELEFDNIWRQHEAEKERAAQSEAAATEAASAGSLEAAPIAATTGEPAADAGAPEAVGESGPGEAPTGDRQAATEEEETLKADYRKIAERRVRLGLLLAEVGRSNNITVTQDELNQALTREAQRHPGYERQVLEYYRRNPEAVNNLRAPIFEEKVVDFIIEMAKPEERKVTPEGLIAAVGADG